jgi:hypothetical protein
MTLEEYVVLHTERGECQCDQCIDKCERPDPVGHTVDVFFFKVAAKHEPSADQLKKLIRDHAGVHCDLDPLDGGEHSYINVGGWIGSQQIALLFIALGQLVGLWDVLTPNLLPVDDETKQQMAGMGMVSIRPSPEAREEIKKAMAAAS